MTAAIARAEVLAEMPSRRLRQESERVQAPAMLFGASLIAVMLFAFGLLPSPGRRAEVSPKLLPGFEFLPEVRTPSTRDSPIGPGLVAVDPQTTVRPVERHEDPTVVVPELREDPAGTGPIGDPASAGHFEGGGAAGRGGESGDDPQPGDVVDADVFPSVVTRVAPEYPALARDAGVEGTVVVWALVGRDGRVEEVRIDQSIPMLDIAAQSAVQGWRFTPALANRHPVRVWVAVPVRFKLHG